MLEALFNEFKAWFYVGFMLIVFLIAMIFGDFIVSIMNKIFGGRNNE